VQGAELRLKTFYERTRSILGNCKNLLLTIGISDIIMEVEDDLQCLTKVAEMKMSQKLIIYNNNYEKRVLSGKWKFKFFAA